MKDILRRFNVKGYSDENSKYIDNSKDGKILKLQIDNYTYEDEFYGGEPYSGNETIWRDNKVVYRVVYWGKVSKDIEFNNIYTFLRKALSLGPDNNLVHRGPSEYIENNLKYTNEIEGDINEFRQIERIYMNNEIVYIAYFNGGHVNIR